MIEVWHYKLEKLSVCSRLQIHSLTDCELAVVIMKDKDRLKSIECLIIGVLRGLISSVSSGLAVVLNTQQVRELVLYLL